MEKQINISTENSREPQSIIEYLRVVENHRRVKEREVSNMLGTVVDYLEISMI